jgi:hypothetical protein
MRNVSILLFFFCIEGITSIDRADAATNSPSKPAPEIHGRVLFPDGTPAKGAQVFLYTDCFDYAEIKNSTKTDAEGLFTFKDYLVYCGNFSLYASDPENFYIETGKQNFLKDPNGATPKINLARFSSDKQIVISLAKRGGRIIIRMADASTKKTVDCHVEIRRAGKECRACGRESVRISGALNEEFFLPAGGYVLRIESFDCHGKTYFARNSPDFTFRIQEGRSDSVTFPVDFASLETEFSYDNPDKMKCTL